MAAADTDKEANRLFTSMQLRALGIIRGRQTPLQPPVNDIDSLCRKSEKHAVDQRLKYSFVGGPATVKRNLESFLDHVKIDEAMAVSHVYGHAARLRSYEGLAGCEYDDSWLSKDNEHKGAAEQMKQAYWVFHL